MNIAVIIPALNEEAALPLVLRDFQHLLTTLAGVESFQLIVADNGSTDQTASLAKKGGAQVVPPSRRGYGSACLAGMSAVNEKTDVVVFVDGDHSVYADDLPDLLQPLLAGQADFVLGERKSITAGALTATQRWGNAFACSLLYQLYGFRYKDLGPYRAIRWPVLKSLTMRDPAYGWTIEMQIKALKKNLRILEVPVRYRPRIGTSKISGTFWGSLNAGRGILWTVFRYAYAES